MKKSAMPALAHHATMLFVVTVLAVALAVPAVAVANPEDAWESIAITLGELDVNKEPTLVISAALMTDTPLPVEVALPVPKGYAILWAGELTGDASQDPIVEISEVVKLEDYDLVRFTLQQSPYAQIELSVPDSVITRTPEGRMIELSWISAGVAERARLGIASPVDLHLQSTEPSATVDLREGIVLYSVEAVPVEAGTRLDLAGLMVSGMGPEVIEARRADAPTSSADATGAPDAGAGLESGPIAPLSESGFDMTTVLLFVLVGALVVVGVLLVRSLKTESVDASEEAFEDEFFEE